ncbi:MAG: T9SS type A sorting domain-containing protein, partial [Bacteroidales bacterium]|nr:T9SS type A sorting domain-containing protein [Bacteroidales bacterium]
TATDDGGAVSAVFNASVTVTPVNDPPVITVPGAQSVAEDINLVFNAANSNLISINDVEDHNQSITISVTNGTFTLSTINGLTGSGSGTAFLIYSGTLANINTALNNAWFKGSQDFNGTASISVITDDGNDETDSESIPITINAVNDPPVITVPGAQSIAEDINLVFSTAGSNQVLISDVENDDQTISISVNNGTFSLSTTSGLTGSGSGTQTLLYSGTRTGINSALHNAYFTGNLNYYGNASVSLSVNDGNGGVDNKIINITITPVNDPPVATEVDIIRLNDMIGTLNTGTFNYSDPETGNFMPGTHVYKWYRRLPGGDTLWINSVSAITYLPVLADGGNSICFEVTPGDNLGLSGDPVKSAFYYVNAAPVAGNVNIYAPDLKVSRFIYGRFTYSDLENNTAGNHSYQWYRSTIPMGTGTPIPQAVDTVYKLRRQDDGRYIRFVVIPSATAGSTPGAAVSSAWIGPVGSFAPTATISGTDTICSNGPKAKITVSLTGEPGWNIRYRRDYAGNSEETTVNHIRSSPYVFDAPGDGTYTLLSVSDTNYTSGSVSGSAVISYFPAATAELTGTTQICQDGISSAPLSIALTGTPPWTFVLKRNNNDTTFTNVTQNPLIYNVKRQGIYKITSLYDTYCQGDTVAGYGTAIVSYIASPLATLSGVDTTCPGDTATLQLQLEGVAPFSITYLHNGTNAKTISNITQLNYPLKVVGNGTYTLTAVSDNIRNGCVSGTGTVVYYTVPTATISGDIALCEHTATNLTVALTGTPPWTLNYREDANDPIHVSGITASPFTISTRKAGSYSVVNVTDKYCNGTATGNATVTITPAPVVSISGLNAAYDKNNKNLIPVFGDPEPGIFTPRLLEIHDTNFFSPYYYGIGIHTVVYSYRDPETGCYGYDTVFVTVMSAKGDITFPHNDTKKLFCYDEDPFIIRGNNTADAIGTFTISADTGMVDNHDNTAIIYPSQLEGGIYTITYRYYDDVFFDIMESFEVEYINDIHFYGFDKSSYCSNHDAVRLNGNVPEGVFSGPAVFGNISAGFYYSPALAKSRLDTVFYTLTGPKGCTRKIFKPLIIYDVADINFTVDDTCIYSGASDSTAFINLTTSTDPVKAWYWNFNDDQASGADNYSTLKDPKHHYRKAERRDVRLKATTSQNCISERKITFYFGDKPTADFSWDNECFHEGNKITFANNSDFNEGKITQYQWKIFNGKTYDIFNSKDVEYQFTEPDNYDVELMVTTNKGCTDTIIQTLPLKPTYSLGEDASYFEGFENGAPGWVRGHDDDANYVNSWSLSEPQQDAQQNGFIGAAKGDYAWWTNIIKDKQTGWAPAEHSWVTSPCFDFAGIKKPMIKLDIWRYFEKIEERDGAVLQYKADTNSSWKNIGDLNDGINWYLNYNISGNPGGQSIGWAKIQDNGWLPARHSIDELKGKQDVQFRIAYGSDGTALQTNGFAFDNVEIVERSKMTLLEHFTNASDNASRIADSALNAFANNNPWDVVDIQYHTSFPGLDPFNEQNKVDPGTRVLLYQLTSVPMTILNGGITNDFRFEYIDKDVAKLVKKQVLMDPKFSIDLNTTLQNNSLNAVVQFKPLEIIVNKQVTLHIAVIERMIKGITGANGDTLFESVLKTILSSTSFTDDWDPEEDIITITKNWSLKHAYNADEIRVVAFIQDESTREVYQSIIDQFDLHTALEDIHSIHRSDAGSGFIVFPNPVFNEIIIRFDEALSKDTQVDFFDINGRLIMTKELFSGFKTHVLSVESCPDGFYFMRITSDNQFIGLQKLVICR